MGAGHPWIVAGHLAACDIGALKPLQSSYDGLVAQAAAHLEQAVRSMPKGTKITVTKPYDGGEGTVPVLVLTFHGEEQ